MIERIEKAKIKILENLIEWLNKREAETNSIIMPHQAADNGYYAVTEDGGEMCIYSVGLHQYFKNELIINGGIIPVNPRKWNYYDILNLYLGVNSAVGVEPEKSIMGVSDTLKELFYGMKKDIEGCLPHEDFKVDPSGAILWEKESFIEVWLNPEYDWMYTESGEPILDDPRPEEISCLFAEVSPIDAYVKAYRAVKNEEG